MINNKLHNKNITLPRLKIIAIVFGSIALSACFEQSNEIEIPLSEVPAPIVKIVQNTLPGIALTEAEKEVDDKKVVYELEGQMINGLEYEIKISEDGTIIKIELED